MNDERKIIFLDVNDILPNRFQPRIKFNEDSLNELSESIKKYGVIEPIVVRPIGDKYEIIAGERRYKACLLAGLSKVPAVVTSLDDKDSAEVALIENVQREDLTPIEEAVSYKKILEMGYMTQEELATKLGKNQGTVANKLRLLNLTEDVQEALLEGRISERHARSLLKLKNDNDQIEMLNKIIANRLTVRKTDEEIEKLLQAKNTQEEIKEEIIEQPQRKEEENMSEFNPFVSDTGINTIPEFNAFAPAAEEDATPAINPGFMDVAKIEETAEDINVEKPQADISSLLTPTDLPEINVEVPQTEETNITEEVSPIESDIKPVVEEESSKFFTAPVEKEETTNEQNYEAAFASNLNSFNESQPFNFNFTPVEPATPAVEEVPAKEDLPIVEEVNVVEENKLDEEPVIIPLPEEKEEVAPVQEEASIPEFNFDELLKGIPSLEKEETPIPEVKVETPVVKEELPTVEVPLVSEQPQVNLMKALDLIRDCGKQLESMGFKVNLDEIDLSNNYQVTFNLEK